jgi:hypothetical protein
MSCRAFCAWEQRNYVHRKKSPAALFRTSALFPAAKSAFFAACPGA